MPCSERLVDQVQICMTSAELSFDQFVAQVVKNRSAAAHTPPDYFKKLKTWAIFTGTKNLSDLSDDETDDDDRTWVLPEWEALSRIVVECEHLARDSIHDELFMNALFGMLRESTEQEKASSTTATCVHILFWIFLHQERTMVISFGRFDGEADFGPEWVPSALSTVLECLEMTFRKKHLLCGFHDEDCCSQLTWLVDLLAELISVRFRLLHADLTLPHLDTRLSVMEEGSQNITYLRKQIEIQLR